MCKLTKQNINIRTGITLCSDVFLYQIQDSQIHFDFTVFTPHHSSNAVTGQHPVSVIPPQQEELTKKGDFTLFKQMSITNECDAHLHF